jgi:thiamine-phosphate pyrophosphorylase
MPPHVFRRIARLYNRQPVISGTNSQILRVIDANANRAREGLRVCEDYARFVLDSAELSGRLKSLRHEMAGALGAILAEAILFRDTPGDVGTSIKTVAEQSREDVSAVVTAAGKRLGEALRVIEEFLKTFDPFTAGRIEAVRYQFYEIERRLALTLRPDAKFSSVRLYVLITESLCRRPWLEAAGQAIVGGADCLQLREKSLEGGEFLQRARQLVELCHKHGVLCIINDRPDIAALVDADGVHVGQGDLPAVEARKIVGNGKIVGVSTHNLEQARQAMLDGADYIGVGPIYKSATKSRDFVAGLEYAAAASAAVKIPRVAIAGIGPENVDDVIATGVNAVAVTAAVIGCDDVAGAARRLKEKIVGGFAARSTAR